MALAMRPRSSLANLKEVALDEASFAHTCTTASFLEEVTAFGSKRLGQLVVGRREARDWVSEDLTAFGSRRLGRIVARRRLVDPKASALASGSTMSLRASSLIPELSEVGVATETHHGSWESAPHAGDEQLGGSFTLYDKEDFWLADLVPDGDNPASKEPAVRNLIDFSACNAAEDGVVALAAHGEAAVAAGHAPAAPPAPHRASRLGLATLESLGRVARGLAWDGAGDCEFVNFL